MLKKIGRNLELDRLRAFAVLMVIGIHYSRIFFPWNIHQNYAHGGTILNLLENSWTGVDLFFVISGYIISKMIVEKIDYFLPCKPQLMQFIKNFYIRRFFRIYPVAWVFFILVLLCSVFFNKTGNFSTPENTIEAGVAIFTYTFNYYFGSGSYHAFTLSPYWSLSIEEQFYLILPFFLIFIQSHQKRIIILFCVLIVLSFIVRPLSPDNIFYTQNRCDGLIYGCLFYYLSIQPAFMQLFKTVKKNGVFSTAIVLAVLFVLGTVSSVGFPDVAIIPLACMLSTLLVGMAALEINIISFGGWINKILDYIGSRSYSLYIAHFPMFTITQEIFFRLAKSNHWILNSHFSIPYTVTAFSFILMCSELSYRFIERPAIARGRDLTNLKQPENSDAIEHAVHAV